MEVDRAKKLMALVRPGVDETRAMVVPSNALIRLDLPTLERPRNAISGTEGGGKCDGLVAESRNFAETFTLLSVAGAERFSAPALVFQS